MDTQDQRPVDTVVLDVDGTLIDSNYRHVRAWAEAFAEIGRIIPEWRIHRAIGMGGDRLVPEVAGECTERAAGDELRARHDALYERVLPHIQPLPGAHQLISTLKERGFRVVVASSGTEEQTRSAIEKLEDSRQLDAWVAGSDVEATKPAPELLKVALERVDGRHAMVVGDSVWDMLAAEELDSYAVGLRCGGFSDSELVDAGADVVYDDPADLVAHASNLPVRRPVG
ncbi:HAD family hydrolase [Nocardioides sp. LHG3406-4]|uniref:HAD family hydrolase n=1 Tax=Nocardioides sp. LHG3406-4 TaxID=2804575 RepID=UPI003CE80669